MRRVEDGVHLPRPELCQAVAADPAAITDFAGVDDRTMNYIEAARPVFDLSGLLLLAATGARSAQGHPMFALLLDARDNLREALPGVRPSATGMHHHQHLERAANAVFVAMTLAEQGLHRCDALSLDRMTEALRRANQELHWATAALPGFAVVDLRQSCCAAHLRD
jgi:hypothetical protein